MGNVVPDRYSHLIRPSHTVHVARFLGLWEGKYIRDGGRPLNDDANALESGS